ncbi:MAG: response regulator [Thermoanaerobaculia bacterium]
MRPAEMGDRRVLVVEDDATIRTLLDIVLSRNGLSVEAVANGQDALTRLGEAHYCVLVLDLMMPVLSGYDLLTEIPTLRWRPHVVIVTTAAKPAETSFDPDIVSAMVSKPFDIFEFGDLVSNIVRSSDLKGVCPHSGVANPSECPPGARPTNRFMPPSRG